MNISSPNSIAKKATNFVTDKSSATIKSFHMKHPSLCKLMDIFDYFNWNKLLHDHDRCILGSVKFDLQ